MKAPPPQRSFAFHVVAAGLAVAVGTTLWLQARGAWATEPARGHTAGGLTLGVAAAVLLIGAMTYALRRRAGQEWLPGRLQTWLRVHVWISLLALWLVLLHAGFHLDDTLGAVLLGLFVLVVVTGLIGWWFYARLPARIVASGPGHLATAATERRIRELEMSLRAAGAGRSEAFRRALARSPGDRAASEPGAVAPGEEEALEEAGAQLRQLAEARMLLADQRRWRAWLRGWTWLHVPLASLLPLGLAWHAADALEVPLLLRAPRPTDFASPESCRECHVAQYEEWISSMHAMAQSSPTVDAQNRLVLAVERARLASGELRTPVVDDVCVKCHAPTGSQPFLDEREGPLALLGERAPASRFGVSCVACHQVDAMHAADPATHPTARTWQNAENLSWHPGRTQRGVVGPRGAPPSVGNGGHRGERLEEMGTSEFCASCHTVMVVDPNVAPERQRAEGVLKLQDTYQEWVDGGGRTTSLNWSALGVSCLHCHGRDLAPMARLARELEQRGVPLDKRVETMRLAIVNRGDRSLLGDATALAASPADAFDLPLPPRRRFLHTFVGVDHPLGTDVPYPADHPRHGENAGIRERMKDRTEDLLRIAAGIEIASVRTGEVEVRVANLATGHHLPAGFAFAREMWLEVAVADARRPGGWRIVVGGNGRGGELAPGERLDKSEGSGLRNFQAVLWTGQRGQDTVLQNETQQVLTGAAAVAQGFPDRVGFLLPGEIRSVTVPCRVAARDRVRVRLLFRALPPEFIGELADRLERAPAGHLYPDGDATRRARQAAELRAMQDDPPILEMAVAER